MTARQKDCWFYAFAKYARNIEKAPASIRRGWSIAAVQHNAAEFANAIRKTYPSKCPVIKFDKLGRPIVSGKEFKW